MFDIQKHGSLDFPAFWQAHLDPQICLAGTNSDCGGLMVIFKDLYLLQECHNYEIENSRIL